MIDIKHLIENEEQYKKALKKKKFDIKKLDEIIKLYKEKNETLTKLEELKAEQNNLSHKN